MDTLVFLSVFVYVCCGIDPGESGTLRRRIGGTGFDFGVL